MLSPRVIELKEEDDASIKNQKEEIPSMDDHQTSDEIQKKKKKKKKKNKKKKQQQQQQEEEQKSKQIEEEKNSEVQSHQNNNGMMIMNEMMDTDWSKLFEETDFEVVQKGIEEGKEQIPPPPSSQHHYAKDESLPFLQEAVTSVIMGQQKTHHHEQEEGAILKLIGIDLVYAPSNSSALLPAYWENELPKASICGEIQPYNIMIHECEPMKVLARSRDGQFIACAALPAKKTATQQQKKLTKKQRKSQVSKLVILQMISNGWTVIHEISNFQYESSSVMITDSIQKVTIQANVMYQKPQSEMSMEEEEEDDDGVLECFKPEKEDETVDTMTQQHQEVIHHPIIIAVSIPPATLLIKMSHEEVICVTLSTLQQQQKNLDTILLNGIEAQAVNSFIQTYLSERQQALSDAFWRFQEVTNCPNRIEYCCDSFTSYGDFTLSYTSAGCASNSQKFPSLLNLTKNIGRPSFSADKGPRLNKSPSLNDDEEMEGIFTLFTILRHMRNFVDHWSITQQTQALFSRSNFYGQLISKRTEMVAVVWQLRRWLPLCKLLGKRERNILKLLNPSKLHWMQTRGAELRVRIKKWIKNGEPSLPIVGPTPYETMHEWVNVWLNKMAEDPTFNFNGARMDGKQIFPSWYTDDLRNEDLQSMDDTRKQMLSQIMTSVSKEEELPFIESKAKKIQKGFQQLAQNLSGHERNYKALLTMLSKVDSIIRRIDCVEKDVEKTISDMKHQLIQKEGEDDEEEEKEEEEEEKYDQKISEEDEEKQQKLSEIHQMIKMRMKSIEQHYGLQIQDTMKPSKQILGEKRKLSETQEDIFSTLSEFISQETSSSSSGENL